MQIFYEFPIRKYLNSLVSNNIRNEDIKIKANRRLLNAPFFVIGLDLSFWFVAAIIYSILYSIFTTNELAANRVFFQILALLILVQGTYGTGLSASIILEHVRSSVITNSLISICVGICLTGLVSLGFSRPMRDIILVLKRIREGYLDGKVKVTTNDEIGYAGDVINEMTQGLKERERMKQSLELAKEVQCRFKTEDDITMVVIKIEKDF